MDDIKAGDYIFITAPHLLEIDNQVLIDSYRININDEYEVTRVVGDSIFFKNNDGDEVSIDVNFSKLSMRHRRNETITNILL